MIWFLLVLISFALMIYTFKVLDDYVPLWGVILAGVIALVPFVNVFAIIVALVALAVYWINTAKIQALLEKKIL